VADSELAHLSSYWKCEVNVPKWWWLVPIVTQTEPGNMHFAINAHIEVLIALIYKHLATLSIQM